MAFQKHLTTPLKQFYATYGVLERFEEDVKYLEKAFIHIEQMWGAQIQSIKKNQLCLTWGSSFLWRSQKLLLQ